MNSQKNREIRKANYWFLLNILYSLISALIGFLTVKFIVFYYGESINGSTRFISQFITYITILQESLFLMFTVKIVMYFRNNELEKIQKIGYWIRRFSILLAFAYLLLLIIISITSSFLLSTDHLPFILMFSLFFSIGIRVFFDLLFLSRFSLVLSATNNIHILIIIQIFIRLFLFTYFLIIILFHPPQLVVSLKNGVSIQDYKNGDIYLVYSLVWGYCLSSLQPIITRIILIFFYSKYNTIFVYTKMKANSNFQEVFGGKLGKLFYLALIINISSFLFYSTDEFAMLLLKDKYSLPLLFKYIGLYGMYISVASVFRMLLRGYVNTKIAIIVKYKNDINLMRGIKSNNYIFASVFFIFSIILIPLFIKFAFQPKDSNYSYAQLSFALPIMLAIWLDLINLPLQKRLELLGHLNKVAWIYVITAIINIVLSFGLVHTLGIFWILWATIIASLFRIMLTEIIVYKITNFESQFKFINLKNYIIIITLTILGFLEVIVLLTTNLFVVIATYIFAHFFFLLLTLTMMLSITMSLYCIFIFWKKRIENR